MNLDLNVPPDYEYQTEGPFWIAAVRVDGVIVPPETVKDLNTAIVTFWARHDEIPTRHRVMVDARGETILGCSSMQGPVNVVGTRQTMELTLAMVEANGTDEEALEVLTMVERIRDTNGGVP